MHRQNYIPTVLVVFVSFMGSASVTPPCAGYDSLPASVLSEARDLDDASYISDSAVQPAGYYDSRPRPSTAAKSQTGMTNSGSTAKKSAPLFHGQKVRMPALPFGRQTAANSSASQHLPQPTIAPGVVAAQPGRAYSGPPVGNPRASSSVNSPVRVPSGRPPQQMPRPIRQAHTPNGSDNSGGRSFPTLHSAPPLPNAANVLPNNEPAATPPAAFQGAMPIASAAVPLTPADRLATQAHDLSVNAQTEQDYTQVAAFCQKVLASQPNSATAKFAQNLLAWSLNRRGQLKAEAGRDDEAIADFAAAVHADPACWRAIHNRGVLLAQAGQFEKAFDDFSNTIRLNPQFAKAYSNRAALLLIADRLDAALKDYHQCIELDPNLAVAQRGCGRVCQLLGQMDEALTHYDTAIHLAPDDSFAAACRADLLTDLGKYADAASEYDRALQLDSKSVQSLTGSAWLLATCPDDAIRNPGLAMERAQTAIEIGGDNDALNLDTLAAAQASAGNFEAAMATVHKAIKLAPEEERGAYHDRLLLYEKAKPFRIAPIEHVAQQASYEIATEAEGRMK